MGHRSPASHGPKSISNKLFRSLYYTTLIRVITFHYRPPMLSTITFVIIFVHEFVHAVNTSPSFSMLVFDRFENSATPALRPFVENSSPYTCGSCPVTATAVLCSVSINCYVLHTCQPLKSLLLLRCHLWRLAIITTSQWKICLLYNHDSRYKRKSTARQPVLERSHSQTTQNTRLC